MRKELSLKELMMFVDVNDIIKGTAFVTKGDDECAVYLEDTEKNRSRGVFIPIDELPESVQQKICVLSLLPPSNVPLRHIEGIGDVRTDGKTEYWAMMTAEEANEFYEKRSTPLHTAARKSEA
jgi:hypothetical protein